MRQYELLVLFPGTLDETAVTTARDSVRTVIAKHQGRITKEERWDKRKLAYPIEHEQQGNYCLFLFDAEPTALSALDGDLRIEKAMLRHQIVHPIVKSVKELDQERRRAERLTRIADEERKEAAPAVTAAELDEKLEKILTEDVAK